MRNSKDLVMWFMGYHAPTLTLSSDGRRRTAERLNDLDFLFAALENPRRVERRIKLWLFGEPSESIRRYAPEGRRDWIKFFGYVPFSEILNYVSNFDIGVYPRTWAQPEGRFNVKLAQFMACGVPIDSTDLDESFILKEARCAIVCKSQEAFSQAVVELAQSVERRAELGNAGRSYAKRTLDLSALAPICRDILNGVPHDR